MIASVVDPRELAGRPAYVNMARAIAFDSAERAGIHPDDAESSALYGLWLAARSWDPGGAMPFRMWASRRIRGAILDDILTWRRANRQAGEIISRSEPVDGALSGEDPAELVVDSFDAAESLMGMAPEATRPILRAIYLDAGGGSIRLAAKMLKQTPNGHFAGKHAVAIVAIREALAARGIRSRAELES